MVSSGTVFFSLADRDKAGGVEVARRFVELGFELAATEGTAGFFEEAGVPVAVRVGKVGDAPHTATLIREQTDAATLIRDGKIDLVVNTPRGRGPRADGAYIRRAASKNRIVCLTTVAAARAAVGGIAERSGRPLGVRSLQEYHQRTQAAPQNS